MTKQALEIGEKLLDIQRRLVDVSWLNIREAVGAFRDGHTFYEYWQDGYSMILCWSRILQVWCGPSWFNSTFCFSTQKVNLLFNALFLMFQKDDTTDVNWNYLSSTMRIKNHLNWSKNLRLPISLSKKKRKKKCNCFIIGLYPIFKQRSSLSWPFCYLR